MKSLEEIRQTLLTDIKTVLSTNLPSVKVAYPNFFDIDLENFTDPYFILVDIELGSDVVAGDIGNSDISVYGSLIVHAVFVNDKGWAGSTGLTDVLATSFLSTSISGIDYTTMKVYNSAPYPGYKGRKHVIKFICS